MFTLILGEESGTELGKLIKSHTNVILSFEIHRDVLYRTQSRQWRGQESETQSR